MCSVYIIMVIDIGLLCFYNEDVCYLFSKIVISCLFSFKIVVIVCDGIGG